MGVAKAALECAVRYLAYDLGPDGIRVNALSPGPLPTVSAMVIEHFDQIVEKFETVSPMLRAMTPRDVGNAAVVYAADIFSAMTGAVIPVDGGMDIMIASAGAHPRAKPRGDKS
jgi:enoyl-[acyl-carrier protein] reductase I